MSRPLILGSASPRRLALLHQICIRPAQVLSADIDETPRKQELPKQYTTRMALEKAQALRERIDEPDYALLCADTTVAVGRRILGKPCDAEEAKHYLTLMSGRRHKVMTALCVMTPHKIWQRTVETRVAIKRLSQKEMTSYLDSQEWRGKAGGYAIQGLAGAFIPWINGSYSNVVGLPLVETRNLLSAVRVVA